MSINSQVLDEVAVTVSSALNYVFPEGVETRERRLPGTAAELLPSELEYVSRAHPKRIGDFAAGRACARAALAALGVPDFALHPAGDRQPIWPEGFTGSITHTTGFCAAVVSSRRSQSALGLDSEVVGAPTEDIWATICGPDEQHWLDALPDAERPAAITLLFSAKEAFYKCQYPLVGEWLDFHDLIIQVRDWSQRRGEFTVRSSRKLRIAQQVTLPFTGRYIFHERFVSAGVCVPAQGRQSNTPCRRETPLQPSRE